MAQYIQDKWPDKQHLELWMKQEPSIYYSQYKDVTRYIDNQEIVKEIHCWKVKAGAHIKLKYKQQMEASADNIVRVFPDRRTISCILHCHSRSERSGILKLLPTNIKEQLVNENH